jgi:hypothetical protein
MHSTRVAAFLVGAWIACSLFLGWIALRNLSLSGSLLANSTPQAAEIMNGVGTEKTALLLRHFASEQNRYYFSMWGWMQIPLALVLAGVLYVAAEKRAVPLVLCGSMLALVLFQHFAVIPEYIYRGRDADFPPGSLAFGAQARVWLMTQVLVGTEAAKLLIAMVLAGYLFTYKSLKRLRRREDPLKMVNLSGVRDEGK